MANAIDWLFKSVIDKLPSDVDELLPRRPDIPEAGEVDPIDGPPDTVDDQIDPYRIFDHAVDGGMVELSSFEKELVEGGIRARGFEALAFYKSTRLIAARPYPGKWGIFYLKPGLVHVASGLVHVACEISRTNPRYRAYKDPMRLARDFFRMHEHFHFRADIQTLLFEAALNKHLYFPLRRALIGRRTHFVEEALANKRAYEWAAKQTIGLQQYA
ncbi:MAG TPA: hypothetical protein VEK34_13660 [Methylocella sp.]|nr:hypothetical protein [Methylocella sp.]